MNRRYFISAGLLASVMFSGCSASQDCAFRLKEAEGFSWTWEVANPVEPPLKLRLQMTDYEGTLSGITEQIELKTPESALSARLEESDLFLEAIGKDWSQRSEYTDAITPGYTYAEAADEEKLAIGDRIALLTFHYGHPVTDGEADHSKCRRLMARFMRMDDNH